MRVRAVRDRPDQPPLIVVQVDQDLADDRAVEERHDPVLAVEASVDRESRDQPHVQLAPVPQRVPDVIGVGIDQDLFANGSHVSVSCWSAACAGRTAAARRLASGLKPNAWPAPPASSSGVVASTGQPPPFTIRSWTLMLVCEN